MVDDSLVVSLVAVAVPVAVAVCDLGNFNWVDCQLIKCSSLC